MYPAGHHGEGRLSVSGHHSAPQVQVRRWWDRGYLVTFLGGAGLVNQALCSLLTLERVPLPPHPMGRGRWWPGLILQQQMEKATVLEETFVYWAKCLRLKASRVSRWSILIGALQSLAGVREGHHHCLIILPLIPTNPGPMTCSVRGHNQLGND